MPVLNEERHLEAAIRRVLDQDYPGELEVILAVGPSSDRTREIADALAAVDRRIRVVDNPAARTPTALNLGIAAVPARDHRPGRWTRRAAPTAISGGPSSCSTRPVPQMSAVLWTRREPPRLKRPSPSAYTTRLGLGGSAFHLAESPAAEAETVFLGVFRKDALVAVGGFDESMHRAQDWELNYRLRTSGHKIWFSPELRVTYRPRSTLRALVKQMYETGTWRREVVRRYPETATARYLAPPLTLIGVVVGSVSRAARCDRRLPAAASRVSRSGRLSGVDHRWLVDHGATACRRRLGCDCRWCWRRPISRGGLAS